MAPIPQKRHHDDMQHPTTCITSPTEYNDSDYIREVLQFEDGQTETVFDDGLLQQAERLGITISRPQSPTQNASMCQSPTTDASHHARTASSGSRESTSTAMTVDSFGGQDADFSSSTQTQMRKRPSTRRSLSFSEYEKYLEQTTAQQASQLVFSPPPIPVESAPSIFSVSSRKSYQSLRNGIKNKFRLRRGRNASMDNLKWVQITPILPTLLTL